MSTDASRTNGSAPVIDIHDMTKIYVMGQTEVHALRGVSVSIHEGEYVAIVGASGSGKSTLMNMIGLLDRPTGGSYRIRGAEVSNIDSALASKNGYRDAGVVGVSVVAYHEIAVAIGVDVAHIGDG